MLFLLWRTANGPSHGARLCTVCGWVLTLGLVAPWLGCATIEEQPLVFVCGCQACSELARALGPSRLANADVYFRGSEGDARRFQETHGLVRAIRNDGDGRIAMRYGVNTCPTVVLPGRRIFGNGAVITKENLDQIARALEGNS